MTLNTVINVVTRRKLESATCSNDPQVKVSSDQLVNQNQIEQTCYLIFVIS
jgi:hypothetical protein